MKKIDKILLLKSKLIFLLCISLFFQQFMKAGILRAEYFYITGNMSADIVTEQTLTFQITGAVSEFSYRYFHPAQYTYRTNVQEDSAFSLSFSSEPDIQRPGTDKYGNSYTDLIWKGIGNTALDITITQQATVRAILDPLVSSDPFPVNQGTLPLDVQQYLTGTGMVQSTDQAIKAKADELVAGCTHQFQAVENIVKWILNNIEYDANPASDARSTLMLRKGVCTNFAHLACALLRAGGIPARFVSGISLARMYDWSIGYSTYYTSWLTGPHSWVEVYYPELGWIPYDAQRDIHHVDIFRLKEAHGRDNSDLSAISWSYYHAAPSVTQAETGLVFEIKNDVVHINCLRKTDDITAGDYALSLEVTPGAVSQSVAPAGPVASNSPTGNNPASSANPAHTSSTAGQSTPGRQASSYTPPASGYTPGFGGGITGGFGSSFSGYSPAGSFVSSGGVTPVVSFNPASPLSPSSFSYGQSAAYSQSPRLYSGTAYNYGAAYNYSPAAYSPAAGFGYGGSGGGGGSGFGSMSSGWYSPVGSFGFTSVVSSPITYGQFSGTYGYSSSPAYGFGFGTGSIFGYTGLSGFLW
ncbi:MAG: transglutaminase domain-containing protein [bacterium]